MTDIAITKDMSIKACVMMAQTDIDTFCKELSMSSFCPANFKGNPIDIKFAILWGAELGLNAFQCVTGIKVINGKPTLYGDILLAVCKSNPDWQDMIETYDESKKTAYCEVRRKGHEPLIRSFSYAQAQTAKLIKPGPWSTYPERMLQHRARGFALRDMYADSLCGLIDHTEAEDYPTKDVTPGPDLEVDHFKAELWQQKLADNQRATRQMLSGFSDDLKKRLWLAIDEDDKTYIKECIKNKPEVTHV
jgi:hypothetical protein